MNGTHIDTLETVSEFAVDLNSYKPVIRAILSEFVSDFDKLGSITADEASDLWLRLTYEDYCIKYGIPYEALTVDDFAAAYEEKALSESEAEECYI